MKRRDFINLTALVGTTGLVSGFRSPEIPKINPGEINSLRSITNEIVPISVAERESRIEKAQRLLVENKMAALILDCGTSLSYFTGIKWWPSERTMVAIIPAHGTVRY